MMSTNVAFVNRTSHCQCAEEGDVRLVGEEGLCRPRTRVFTVWRPTDSVAVNLSRGNPWKPRLRWDGGIFAGLPSDEAFTNFQRT